jgi:hypothetical protein
METMMGLDQPSPAEALPFGLMPLAPTGQADRTYLAEAMADHLRAIRPASSAEALRALRRAYPNSPLTLRVLALGALMQR